MNIYRAITLAADQIDQHPERFNFLSCAHPECGSPSCALGWIGFFLDVPEQDHYPLAVAKAMGIPAPEPVGNCKEDSEEVFYSRMRELNREKTDIGNWHWSAKVCAELLRDYAEIYHASDKIKAQGIPASVLRIFNKETA